MRDASNGSDTALLDVEEAVLDRYSTAAGAQEPTLCCPVEYDPRFLLVIPDEIIQRDYGCGDPSRHLKSGERVLDLGSGGGKICYIASQVVGESGQVVGVDMSDEMLELANRHRSTVAEQVGWSNVSFRKGKIQDLRLDWAKLEHWLQEHPVRDATGVSAMQTEMDRLRRDEPLIPDGSIDVVVSNCVLNLVADEDKRQLFGEIYRVLDRSGRVVISDIVSDEPVPSAMKADPELWSGCISGALTESGFLAAFEDAGFYGIEIIERGRDPWRTVEGIEFRSLTVTAFKGKDGACLETNKAAIYRGPWKRVEDDDGHTYERGVPAAVCEKTYRILMREPYAGEFESVLPREPISMDDAQPFDCSRTARRLARESKGLSYDLTSEADPAGPAGAVCGPGGTCC